MRRDKCDEVFSHVMRESYNWTCSRCAKYFPVGNRQGLHASHIYSRRHMLLRWHPLNVVAHCFACHQWYGGNPVLGGRWASEYLGAGVIDLLMERLRDRRKYTKADKEEIYAHYKSERTRIEALRKAGAVGIIAVIPFD